MKHISHQTIHLLLFFLSFLCIMSLQGSIWMQLFTQAPNPCLWIVALVYCCFYRNLYEFIFCIYIITLISLEFTNFPFGLFLICNSGIALILLLIRSRFILQKPIYLAIITLFLTFIFPLLHFIFSHLFEPNPIQTIEHFTWIISALITSLLSITIFHFFIWFDAIFNKKLPVEVRTF